MPRLSLLLELNQATADSLAFVIRSLQWPSLSSIAIDPQKVNRKLPKDRTEEVEKSTLLSRLLNETKRNSNLFSNAQQQQQQKANSTRTSPSTNSIAYGLASTLFKPLGFAMSFPLLQIPALAQSAGTGDHDGDHQGEVVSPTLPLESMIVASSTLRQDTPPADVDSVAEVEHEEDVDPGLDCPAESSELSSAEIPSVRAEVEPQYAGHDSSLDAASPNDTDSTSAHASLAVNQPDRTEDQDDETPSPPSAPIPIKEDTKVEDEVASLEEEKQPDPPAAASPSVVPKQESSEELTCKDPKRCTHSTKHVNVSKCNSALKKKSCVLECDSLLCLQCGRVWADDAAADTHASRSNHPVMINVSTGSLVCFKCGKVDVTESIAALTEPTLTDIGSIKNAFKNKVPSSTPKTQSKKKSSSTSDMDSPQGLSAEPSANVPMGLKNLGNTCFFNSSLQVLAQSIHVREALKDPSVLGPLAMSLARCLQDITATGSSGSIVTTKRGKHSSSVVSPSGLFSAVCKVAPHFSGFEQQDAQELMTFLLGGLEDEATPRSSTSSHSAKHKPKQSHQPRPKQKSSVSDLFNEEWKLKHAEFWFGSDANKVLERTLPVDEDEEPTRIQVTDEEDETCEESADESEEYEEPKANLSGPLKNLTKDVFQIDLESIVVCDDCNTETIRKESQYMLSLALEGSLTSLSGGAMKSVKGGNKKKASAPEPSPVKRGEGDVESLGGCLDRFFSEERLIVADGNGFQCNKCASRRGQKTEAAPPHDASRRLKITALNDVLVIHFKRFQQVDRGGKGIRMTKIETHVTLPETLSYFASEFGDYQLVGCVEHLGKSLHGGHYVAYVKTSPNVWYRCSDDVVSKVPASQVFDSAQAYIAVYERRG